MSKLFTVLFLVALVAGTLGFRPSEKLPFGGAHPILKDEVTPSTVFGRPLTAETKELNVKLVKMVKTTIFDNLFKEKTLERNYARFWALEEVARMPYFAYLNALHFYETIGMWRRSEYLQIHFSQTWNEQHHLLIMEELGGNNLWRDRFIAQHLALGYFWVSLLFYFSNPTFAYNFNQAVEEEAFATYARFLEENESILKRTPAPFVAKDYYQSNGDHGLTMLAEKPSRMDTLYDCFCAVRDDEAAHAEAMIVMQGGSTGANS